MGASPYTTDGYRLIYRFSPSLALCRFAGREDSKPRERVRKLK
jgi:hypothetical protein